MFKKLYLAVDSKVEPNLDLINSTKNKMREELKNKNKVKAINFYKYASVAACLVICIGVISIKQKITSPSYEFNGSIEAEDVYIPETSINNDSATTNNPFFMQGIESSSASTVVANPDSIFRKVIEFFSNIIQWFCQLLF